MSFRFTRKPNKYGAIKSNGYDSRKENKRANELKLLEKTKVISELVEQPSFELQAGFRDRDGKAERALKYVADFAYKENGEQVVEDVKGFKTEIYRIKRKLFKFKYPEICFRET